MAKRIERFEDLVAWQKARTLLMSQAFEVGNVLGGLRRSVERRRQLV